MAFAHTVADQITLPRGKLYFAPFLAGTSTPQPSELYLGNTPGCSLTGEAQKLDHYTADTAIRLKDRSITIEANYSGKLTTDNVSDANLAIFFLGAQSTVSATAQTGVSETFATVVADSLIQLGRTATNQGGARKVASVVVTGKVLGTDYELDADAGTIHPLVSGTAWVVTYNISASARSRVISAGTPVKGALHFVADNPQGANRDYYMPSVVLSPSGDFQIKGDGTAWQQMEFSLEVLTKNAQTPAVVIDGVAA